MTLKRTSKLIRMGIRILFVDFHSQPNILGENDIYRVQPKRLSRSHLPMYETSEVREVLISIRLSFEHKVVDLWGLVFKLIRRTMKA